MKTKSSFKMSQDFELVHLQTKRAYPVVIEEWNYLKHKIQSLRDNSNIYTSMASALIGVAATAAFAALSLKFQATKVTSTPMPELVSWSVFGCASFCSALSYYFAKSQKQVYKFTANDVIEQMELIEKRYESEET